MGGNRILHSPQDDLQAVGRGSLHIANVGEPVQVDVFNMSPQILVHTLIVWALKLLSVHHHFGGVWEKERREVNHMKGAHK